jgi:hypothetical protein
MMVARLLRSAELPPGGSVGRTVDPDEVLDRLPAVSLADLHKGEEIAALGPKGGDSGVLTAIKLVAWVLPDAAAGRGRRGRPGDGSAPADPFADVLDVGGEGGW